ncbi:MAG TPA: hypothetical protein VMH79_10480 [Thermoanaerobaculia bacterium]|nr:hypothetical protein [Thermoanaerobaculia bacterium]
MPKIRQRPNRGELVAPKDPAGAQRAMTAMTPMAKIEIQKLKGPGRMAPTAGIYQEPARRDA